MTFHLCLIALEAASLAYVPCRNRVVHCSWVFSRSHLVFALYGTAIQQIIYILLDHYRVSDNGLKESVNYQIISPKDLAKSVLSAAGWSNFLVLYYSSWLVSYYVCSVILIFGEGDSPPPPPSIYASFVFILFTAFIIVIAVMVVISFL